MVGAMSEWIVVGDPDDADVEWRFHRGFLESNWTCTWGRGCLGILHRPAAELGQGCCSVGAHVADETEAMTVSASAAALSAEVWQYRDAIDEHDVFTDASMKALKVVDGACIFFNRPGFPGGAGCALHIAAEAVGERPIDWKPSVCWQAPLKAVEHVEQRDGGEVTVVTVRPWNRADWGDGTDPIAWCCTDQADRAQFDSFIGEVPVWISLRPELESLAGEKTTALALRGLTATTKRQT